MRSADRQHYGLAVYCARRFQGRGVSMEELIGEAEAALLWAAARFDESRGMRFSTYAVPVVLGALRDACRRAQPMHVPHQDQRVLTRAERERQAFRQQTGREPTVGELALALDVPAEKLGSMLCAQQRMQGASSAANADEAADVPFEDAVLLRDAVLRLPKPFAQVLWLRFGAGYSQTEIAARFGVGQPQVSRWEKKALALMRQLLEA